MQMVFFFPAGSQSSVFQHLKTENGFNLKCCETGESCETVFVHIHTTASQSTTLRNKRLLDLQNI